LNELKKRDQLNVEKDKFVSLLEEKKDFYQKENDRYGKYLPNKFFRKTT